jgi:hypothetical protein
MKALVMCGNRAVPFTIMVLVTFLILGNIIFVNFFKNLLACEECVIRGRYLCSASFNIGDGGFSDLDNAAE